MDINMYVSVNVILPMWSFSLNFNLNQHRNHSLRIKLDEHLSLFLPRRNYKSTDIHWIFLQWKYQCTIDQQKAAIVKRLSASMGWHLLDDTSTEAQKQCKKWEIELNFPLYTPRNMPVGSFSFSLRQSTKKEPRGNLSVAIYLTGITCSPFRYLGKELHL